MAMIFEEAFADAYENWEIEKLYIDLASTTEKPLSPNAKLFLRGVLCGYSPAEIAKILNYQSKKPSDTVRQYLSKEVYPAIKALVQDAEKNDYRKIPQWLKQYKKKPSQPSSTIDISHIYQQLRQHCDEVLQQQKKLTTNDMMRRYSLEFGIDDLFVGLGLVETRKPSKHEDILSSQQGSEFYTPTETVIVQEFKHQQFLNQVICDRQTPKSKGQRIAIIGEPGAGKTTLLQKIAEELQNRQIVPIWISLNKLGDKPLNDYLLEDWLKDAAQAIRSEASEEWKIALEEFLKTNQVCLLLDGVDEITVNSPLQHLSQQLQAGWVNSVRIILTCRVNLWENYIIEGFDAYRTLSFDYPAQVEQFIDQFFIKSEKSQASAEQLKIELQADSKARIQDLVKNPLRLSLLCYIWEIGERKLPQTKAELYQWFVDNFYKLREYKNPALKVPKHKQKELNFALGELAKAALDSNKFRFLLPQEFIESYLGHPDDENSLFYLAKQVGWLNCVGRMAMSPLEDAYAFFHPTFQEYFAALVIDDWDYFLNHIPDNISESTYRIFDKQWQEVSILWIEHHNISEQKIQIIFQSMSDLESDKFHYFFENKLYVVSISLLKKNAQYNRQILCDAISYFIKNLVTNQRYSEEIDEYIIIPYSIDKLIIEALQYCLNETKEILEFYLKTTQETKTKFKLIEILCHFEPDKDSLIEKIKPFCSKIHDPLSIKAAQLIIQLNNNNQFAIAYLIKALNSEKDTDKSLNIIDFLAKKHILNNFILEKLIILLQHERYYIKERAIILLIEIAQNYPNKIKNSLKLQSIMINLLRSQELKNSFIIYDLIDIADIANIKNNEIVNSIILCLRVTDSELIIIIISDFLEKITFGIYLINEILDILINQPNPEKYRILSYLLERHFLKNSLIFKKASILNKLIDIIIIYLDYDRLSDHLLNIIKQLIEEDENLLEFLCNFLDHYDNQDISDTIAYLLTDYLKEKQENIDYDNNDFYNQLIKDRHNSLKELIINNKISTWQDWHDNSYTGREFNEIELVHLIIENIIVPSHDKKLKQACIYAISRSKLFSHPSVITKIVNLFITNNDSDIRYSFIHAVNNVTNINHLQWWVIFLREYTDPKVFKKDPELHYIASSIVWHCAQQMSYPEFYNAWHSQAPQSDQKLLN
jgi:GTPase SAR1 family protein